MIATTLEQSRKLIELGINPDTADMHYAFTVIGGNAFQEMIDNSATLLPGKKNTKYPYEPCWSLAALLELAPKAEDLEFSICFGGYIGDKYISEWVCTFEKLVFTFENLEESILITTSSNSSIDAAFDMIVQLKEKKII